MTTLFTVSIDSIEDRTLRGRVHVVNPDVSYVPDETVFPVTLLMDAWWHIDNGFLYGESAEDSGGDRYPFTAEQGRAITTGMRLRDEFTHLYETILGKKIRVTEDGYLLSEDGKVLEPKRKAADAFLLDGGSGYDGVSHYVTTSGDAAELEERTEEIVTSYEVGEYRNLPLRSEVAAALNEPWDPQQPDGPADIDDFDIWDVLYDKDFPDLPYAGITLTVSDPGYLEHLVAGMRWETTMTGHVC